jgi:hypothetical protein
MWLSHEAAAASLLQNGELVLEGMTYRLTIRPGNLYSIDLNWSVQVAWR